MTSAYENAMSDTQANNYTQKYPVTAQIDNFVRLNGGNERDALNVALARLDRAEARATQLQFELNEANTNIRLMAEHNTRITTERNELRAKFEQAQSDLATYHKILDVVFEANGVHQP